MSMSSRQRTKSMKAAQQLLPDAQVHGYAIGRSGLQPTVAIAAVLAGLFVLAVVMMFLTGFFLMPGLIFIVVIQHFVSPPRALVICDRGIALTNRSIWTGRPSKVLQLTHVSGVVMIGQELGRAGLTIGPEKLWLTLGEEHEFRTACTAMTTPAQA